MAAPSQSSPNQPVQKHSNETAAAAADPAESVKPPPPEVAREEASASKDDTKAEAEETTSVVPTYASSEASEAYKTAKKLLNDGSFDEALNIIEEAISTTRSLLPGKSTDNDLHESLAPLHYLYGTTLLYSVEESDPETALMVENGGASSNSEESAGDLEIAWENLESARHIVQGLITATPTDKLKLDLAQIHLRLADLQRTDGRYLEAILDYEACLKLREPILGVYNRSVADSRYMLGLVYMMLASEGDRQQEKKNDATNAPIVVPPEKIEEYRSNSIAHYLSAARSIAGVIANICGADAHAITAEVSDEESGGGGGKTTGLDPSVISFHSCSRNLRAIRDRVSKLDDKTDDEEVKTLVQMLDEFQEVVDEAENTKRGLHDVSKITAKVYAEIAAADKGEEKDESGATTTVGFGAAGAAAAATATAAPMMVVKKKKKRDVLDAKLPVQEDNAKRSKPTE